MTKFFFLFLFLFLFITSFSVKAQEFSWGIKGGLNSSTVVGISTDGFNRRTGYYVGVTTEFDLIDSWSFAPELLFSSQGLKINDFGADIISNFIYIPMMLKYNIYNNLAFELGPQIGLNVQAKGSTKEGYVSFPKDMYNAFDVGIALGVNYKLGVFVASVRYYNGFVNFAKEQKNKQSILQVGLGVNF